LVRTEILDAKNSLMYKKCNISIRARNYISPFTPD